MMLAAQSPNAFPVSAGPIVTPYSTPAINAPVRVCLASSFGTPCNTAGVTLYSDSNVSQVIGNPTATNSQGIYSFYLNASQYTLPQLFLIQITVTPTVTYSYQVSISAGGGITAIPVPINEGGTGATTAQGAATNIVDNSNINPATVGTTTPATSIAVKQINTDVYVSSTVSVQAAITAACGASPAAHVVLPAGTQTLTAPVTVPSNCNLTVDGPSRYTSIVQASSGFSGTCSDSNSALLCTSTGDTVRLNNLSLLGNGYVGYVIDVQSPGASSLTLDSAQVSGYTLTGINIYDLSYLTITGRSYIGNQSALCTSACEGVNWFIHAVSPAQITLDGGSTFDQSAETTYNYYTFGVFGNATANLPVQRLNVSNVNFVFPNINTRESDGAVFGSSTAPTYPAQILQASISNVNVTGVGGYTSSHTTSGISIGVQLAGIQSLAYTGGTVTNTTSGLYVENCPSNASDTIAAVTLSNANLPGLQYINIGSTGILASVAAANLTAHANGCQNVNVVGNYLYSAGYVGSAIQSDGWSSFKATGNTIVNWYHSFFANGAGSSAVGNDITYNLGSSAGSSPVVYYVNCGSSTCPSSVSDLTFSDNTIHGNPYYGILFSGTATYSAPINLIANVIPSAVHTPYTLPASGTTTLDLNGTAPLWNGSPLSVVPPVTNVPLWLQFLGNGSEGAEDCSGNLSGDHYYTTFTVDLGNTCTVNYSTGLHIHATGACTINGTITATPLNSVYYPGPTGTGGGGGGGTNAGTAAIGAGVFPSNGTSNFTNSTAAGGTAGASSGGAGGNGNQALQQWWQLLLSAGTNDGLMWYGGPGGGASGGATGGYGGGPVILSCGSIVGSGTINTSGGAGGNSAANNAGTGGGGAAGPIVLSSQAAETWSLTLTQNGGAAGSCGSFTGCGVGGTGAAGQLAEFQNW